MATQITSTPVRRNLLPRIVAQLPVQLEWTDAETGETVHATGTTENVGEMSALINMDNLPPVGGEVHLRVKNEDDTLLEVETEVIRVQRDPSKPLAALNVLDHIEEWQTRVLTTAQEVADRTWASEEDEWVN